MSNSYRDVNPVVRPNIATDYYLYIIKPVKANFNLPNIPTEYAA